jgi:hypothetical protein
MGKKLTYNFVPLAGTINNETKRLYPVVDALRSIIDRLEV